MEKKRYSSYAQIENELEILKVEKELNIQRIVLNVHHVKEGLTPINIIKEILGDYKSILSNHSGTLFNFALPFLINWFRKRKRGN